MWFFVCLTLCLSVYRAHRCTFAVLVPSALCFRISAFALLSKINRIRLINLLDDSFSRINVAKSSVIPTASAILKIPGKSVTLSGVQIRAEEPNAAPRKVIHRSKKDSWTSFCSFVFHFVRMGCKCLFLEKILNYFEYPCVFYPHLSFSRKMGWNSNQEILIGKEK